MACDGFTLSSTGSTVAQHSTRPCRRRSTPSTMTWKTVSLSLLGVPGSLTMHAEVLRPTCRGWAQPRLIQCDRLGPRPGRVLLSCLARCCRGRPCRVCHVLVQCCQWREWLPHIIYNIIVLWGSRLTVAPVLGPVLRKRRVPERCPPGVVGVRWAGCV